MGASTVVTQTILFIAVLGIAGGLLVSIKGFTDKTEGSLKLKSDAFQNQVNTDYVIEYVHYDNVSEQTNVYVRNIGKTPLKLEDIDVYVDGIRIPSNITNRTIGIEADTDTINTGIWDYNEKLKIVAKLALSEGVIHEVVVTSSHGGKELESFST